jgi:hypothetical protein
MSRLAVALAAGAVLLASGSVEAAVMVRRSVAYRPRPVAPVARTAAVATAAVATAAVVGSVVHTLPASCHSVVVGNVAYQECGGAWYQPRYAGSEVTYTVVNPPQ